MITIRKYQPTDADMWNDFVARAKNATFLHNRNYMDYHSDRFDDFSLMAFDGTRLIALLPANRVGDTLYSHQGLTYGGWLMPIRHFNAATMLDVADTMVEFLRSESIKTLIYKAVPHIFHRYPAEEDLYALFRLGAREIITNMSSAVFYRGSEVPYNRRVRRACSLALDNGVTVAQSADYEAFWRILTDNLQEKYGVNPVHSLDEIVRLSKAFPQEINLYMAYAEGEPVAGCVIYDHGEAVHAQYSSANPHGAEIGALAYLFHHLIADVYADRTYFDFGISNERDGTYLNANLIEMKSGQGARGIAYHIYQLDL